MAQDDIQVIIPPARKPSKTLSKNPLKNFNISPKHIYKINSNYNGLY